VGGSCLAVVAVIALGLALQHRGRDEPQNQPDAEQLAARGAAPGTGSEVWVRRTHEASGAAWEFPTTGESSPTSSVVRLADQKPLQFSVTIKDIPAREKNSPPLHPLAKLRAARPGGVSAFGPVVSTGTIDGRPSVVIRAQNYAALVAADYDRTYEFMVTMPDRDEGSRRTKRFFESVRITLPMPSEHAGPSAGGVAGAVGGEAIPPGWDRVQVPRSQMTLLMPKGAPPGGRRGVGKDFDGTIPVVRGLVTPDGDEIGVYACYVEATMLGPNIGDPFGGVKEVRTRVVGGHTARQEYRVAFGQHMVHEVIDLGAGGLKFYIIAIVGEALDFNSPEVKRVLDSVSFTLPAKVGPEAPEDLTPPPWTRRFAPGGTFSVEMPGRSRAGTGVGLGPALAWASKGQIPLAGKKKMEFVVTGLGIAAPNMPDPRRVIELEIKGLGGPGSQMKLVRRIEVGGRPGFVAARTDKNGYGFVQMKVQDVVMSYAVHVGGPGVTADTPEVKRCIESASFTVKPDGPAKDAAGTPK
jgi:hypothetical protein